MCAYDGSGSMELGYWPVACIELVKYLEFSRRRRADKMWFVCISSEPSRRRRAEKELCVCVCLPSQSVWLVSWPAARTELVKQWEHSRLRRAEKIGECFYSIC